MEWTVENKNILLSIDHLSKNYYDKQGTIAALCDVSLSIFQGEILGLLGVNGAGKTTLSTIIAGFHPPSSGNIFYHEHSIYQDLSAYKYLVGYCPQKPNFGDYLSIEENLLFAGRFFHMPEDEVHARAAELMKSFDITFYARRNPDVLSGGYRQRLNFARALMHKPKLIILDEPTVGLDPHIRRGLWEVISKLRAEGATVVLTTHYLDEAEILADRICILESGRVKLIDRPDNLKLIYHKSKLEDVFLHLMEENVIEETPEEKID